MKLILNNLFGTDPYSTWGQLSQAEKDLIKNFPDKALVIYNNRPIAEKATVSRFGRNGRNDKSDAFRHSYFNALNTKDIGSYMAELFSTAHESEVPPSLLLEAQMDLFNNNIGHRVEIDHPNKSELELEDIFYQKILDGEMRYLSPLGPATSPNNGINSNTKLTPTNK